MCYTIVQHGVMTTNALAFLPVGRSTPKVVYKGVDPSLDSGTWHVGIDTVRELRLPAGYFSIDNREYILGTTLLTVGSTSPYTVTYRSLVSKRSGTLAIGVCPTQPSWEYDDSLPWPEAPLVCERQGANSALYLIGNGGVSLASAPLPPRPPSADEYVFWALGFNGPHFQHLLWDVQQSEMAAPLLGSGILNLQTGQEQRVPNELNNALFVSPNGTLYALTGNTLSRWTGTGLLPLGTVANLRVEAVDDSGVAWASSPWATTELVREVPGAGTEQSWTVYGSALGYGPGYTVWAPNAVLYGPTLRVMFPLEGRTLSFSGVAGQPLIYGQTDGDLVPQIIFPTETGAAVIEISTAPTFPAGSK
ncbi:MAG: hypothetical protein M0Z66_05825 [Thermaerobacter sp.]|nr:hypothetical protein [Thermaerobacter sp.]